MAKSAAFGVIHLGIAFGVGYAFTGSLTIAGAITLVEPLVNTVAHFVFDRWWDRRHGERRYGRDFKIPRFALTAAPTCSTPRPSTSS